MSNVRKLQQIAKQIGFDPLTLKPQIRAAEPFVQAASEPVQTFRETGTLADSGVQILKAVPYLNSREEKIRTLSNDFVSSLISSTFNSSGGSTLAVQEIKPDRYDEMLRKYSDFFINNDKPAPKVLLDAELAKLEVTKEPYAFAFCREGMQYKVTFKDRYGEADKADFHISPYKIDGGIIGFNVGSRKMGRAEADFAISVIAASLTIDQHGEFKDVLERLRTARPATNDNFINRNAQEFLFKKGYDKYMFFDSDRHHLDIPHISLTRMDEYISSRENYFKPLKDETPSRSDLSGREHEVYDCFTYVTNGMRYTMTCKNKPGQDSEIEFSTFNSFTGIYTKAEPFIQREIMQKLRAGLPADDLAKCGASLDKADVHMARNVANVQAWPFWHIAPNTGSGNVAGSGNTISSSGPSTPKP